MQRYKKLFESELDINVKSSLYQNLLTLIEWEYKYQYVSSLSVDAKMLQELIHRELVPVIRSIAKDLQSVYYAWLRRHSESEAYNSHGFDVKSIYKELVDLTGRGKSKNFYETMIILHKALNGVHSTGGMLEYIVREYDITDSDLTYMSNMNKRTLKIWEKEIENYVW